MNERMKEGEGTQWTKKWKEKKKKIISQQRIELKRDRKRVGEEREGDYTKQQRMGRRGSSTKVREAERTSTKGNMMNKSTESQKSERGME